MFTTRRVATRVSSGALVLTPIATALDVHNHNSSTSSILHISALKVLGLRIENDCS